MMSELSDNGTRHMGQQMLTPTLRIIKRHCNDGIKVALFNKLEKGTRIESGENMMGKSRVTEHDEYLVTYNIGLSPSLVLSGLSAPPSLNGSATLTY